MLSRTAFALILGLCSCSTLTGGGDAGISFSSDPPGARVLIDGRDSGFVTPCILALDPEEDVKVDLVLDGFHTETRYLTPDDQVYTILWQEMRVRAIVWNWPLWLNARDFFVPIKHKETLAPGRVYVRLDRTADQKPLSDAATR
jgi:hypothetical protein